MWIARSWQYNYNKIKHSHMHISWDVLHLRVKNINPTVRSAATILRSITNRIVKPEEIDHVDRGGNINKQKGTSVASARRHRKTKAAYLIFIGDEVLWGKCCFRVPYIRYNIQKTTTVWASDRSGFIMEIYNENIVLNSLLQICRT